MSVEQDYKGAAARLRARLGPVGVWMLLLSEPATAERAAARRLEDLGYGALWVPEGPFTKEAFAHAATLLGVTERLTVATGVANLWMREPAAMAAGAATLNDAYNDRFLLGIGASHVPFIEQLGRRPTGPVTTMRGYLDRMDEAPYAGPRSSGGSPRVLAALGPRMLEVARERAAGAHPYLVPVEHTRRARAALGPDRLLAPEQGFVLEVDPSTARAVARRYVGEQFSMANYANSLRRLGFSDADLADEGSDRLIDAVVVWGDVDAIAARVQAHLDAGADHVALQPIGVTLEDSLKQLAVLRASLPTHARS